MTTVIDFPANELRPEIQPETRAEWYARKHGGGPQKARKDHRCDFRDVHGLRCQCVIKAKSIFFNTNAQNPHSTHPYSKIKLCDACASGKIFFKPVYNYKGE